MNKYVQCKLTRDDVISEVPRSSDMLIVSFDRSKADDTCMAVVHRQRYIPRRGNGKTLTDPPYELVNVFYGNEAEDLYSKLTKGEKK